MENKKTALITGSYGGLGTCFVNIHAGEWWKSDSGGKKSEKT